MSDLNTFENIIELPVIPLRGLVVFPEMVLHFDVGRKKSIAAIKSAMNSNQKIFLVCQRDASVDDPSVDELFATGVVCTIKQMIRISGSENLRVFVEGIERGDIVSATQTKPYINSVVRIVEENNSAKDSRESLAYLRALRKEFEKYATLMPKISNDVIAAILSIDDGGKLADYICSNTSLDYSEKQSILEEYDSFKRMAELLVALKKDNAALEIEAEIAEKVKVEIDKNQKEYYLREEMKVIAETLGEGKSPVQESDEYREKISTLKCSDDIKDRLFKECDKLMKMPLGSHEATVVRNYLDKCLELPFGIFSKDNIK